MIGSEDWLENSVCVCVCVCVCIQFCCIIDYSVVSSRLHDLDQ